MLSGVWYDRVLAVPAIGVRFLPDVGRLSKRVEQLAPLWAVLEQQGPLNMAWPNPASIEGRVGGWRYSLTPNELVVQFSYDVIATTGRGRLPEFNSLEIQPYSELLQETVTRASEALGYLMADDGTLAVVRIGTVFTASLRLSEPPPGIDQLIAHLGAPWAKAGGLQKCGGELLMALSESDTYHDRCFHNLTFDRIVDNENLDLKLDWQRYYKQPWNHTHRSTMLTIQEIVELARSYFERVGEGSYAV